MHKNISFSRLVTLGIVVLVGIGLFASPFLLRADHDGAINVPQVNCIWVSNHGSIGFDVEFDVSTHPDSDELLSGFQLKLDGFIVDDRLWVKSTKLELEAPNQGWLEIPGYDGGPPLPYPGYSHSFDFVVEGLKLEGIFLYVWGSPCRCCAFCGF